MARIVDPVLVDEDGADQSTELDQRVPVASVAGETRSLDREHGTDTRRTPWSWRSKLRCSNAQTEPEPSQVARHDCGSVDCEEEFACDDDALGDVNAEIAVSRDGDERVKSGLCRRCVGLASSS
jgi:hypothetical protein